MRLIGWLPGLLLLALPLQVCAEVYKAPSPEPTDEETLILEFMNRYRADPKADAARMMPKPGQKMFGWVQVDWQMFKKEVEALKPSPPLVFNLKLLDAARKHSFYMIHNGLGHVEQPGKKGFTGKSFGDRCKAAGYRGAGAENCFKDARGAWVSHAGFVVDFGKGGPGGMQPGRGHRMNMINPRFKEVGCSAVPHGGRFSVTHNFGSSGPRFVGGVVYVDKNGNNFYDPGEGRGGIKVVGSDGSSTTTWRSGAYSLRLKGTKAITVKMEGAGQSTSKALDAGKSNVKFDWIIPQEAELKLADQLLAKLDKIDNKDLSNKKYYRALVELYMGAAHLGLDAGRRKRIDDLVKDVGPKLEAAQQKVRDGLQNLDMKTWPKMLREVRKPFSGTAADAWFKEAEMVGNAKAGAENFKARCEATKVRQNVKNQFLKSLEMAPKALKISYFRSQMEAIVAEVRGLVMPQRGGMRR